MGKSSVLEEMIKSLLEQKVSGNDSLGFTLFDPKFGACTGVMNAVEVATEGKIESKAEFMKKFDT